MQHIGASHDLACSFFLWMGVKMDKKEQARGESVGEKEQTEGGDVSCLLCGCYPVVLIRWRIGGMLVQASWVSRV